MADDTKLRQTFDQEAELYNRIRPHYPEALFERLAQAAKLLPTAELLEIGPGTGQATQPLARRGYGITAIELGPGLADVTRREMQAYPNVRIITGAFEDADLPESTFDLVYAATAFHWIKPEVRFAKPHQLRKPSGHLAILQTHHVSDEQGNAFFHASQTVYDHYYADDGTGKPTLPTPAAIHAAELDTTLFSLVDFTRFPLAVTYTAHEYAQLLNTYSPTLSLPELERRDFLADMEDLINRDFDGRIAKHFVLSLTVAATLPS